MAAAASARLCVETSYAIAYVIAAVQPPLRGCVLKLRKPTFNAITKVAAASARLCVETLTTARWSALRSAAASARLCVETGEYGVAYRIIEAAASARLCVETLLVDEKKIYGGAAASARLCVETDSAGVCDPQLLRSRLCAAVC